MAQIIERSELFMNEDTDCIGNGATAGNFNLKFIPILF